MGIDLSELEAMNAAIAASEAAVQREARAIVSKGALNIKTGWAANAQESSGHHAPHYPRSISYDVTEAPGLIEAEIGPDKDRTQGPLGNILEFGTSTQAGHNDGGRALDDEEPRFEAAVDALAQTALDL
ncbi:hypothetical protein ACIO6U_03730 [Streptomyces sp. NPDC087422]|uniref:hypothetical protein n=1 Tax=Streptomyces sp. NPDC087422 TaxID=3365786 RepID=UPI0038283113